MEPDGEHRHGRPQGLVLGSKFRQAARRLLQGAVEVSDDRRDPGHGEFRYGV